ncbi:MAG: efflux RND transporter periplasmic adaptor subunit [Oscillospiraceae bacterium]|nr:efflux RND transporter periplasmic adaptor subunit [Oscillospiraceae bacterium]
MIEEAKSSKRKKVILTLSIVLGIIILTVSYFIFFYNTNNKDDAVFVMSVADISGKDISFTSNRFMGIVESQEVKDINIETGREVDELLVAVGDSVSTGETLFTYTTADIERRMQQVTIDIESFRNSIRNCYTEIKALESEKASAGEEYQIDYTLQIQSLLASISQTEYNIRAKQIEYDGLKASFDNSVVKAPIDGTIQSINSKNESDPYTGMPLAYIVIMKGGDFVVRGTVSELNVYSLYPGSRVVIRSRIDEDSIWRGTIVNVDTTKTQDESQSKMYYYGSSSDGASKYDFYVEVDNISGLMIGQHVTIELDTGMEETASDGLWIPGWYICDIDDNSYVWAENTKGRLEKRSVTLGTYDEYLDRYEIVSGLGYDDYIAFPDITLKVGQPTTKEYIIDYAPEGDMIYAGEGEYSEFPEKDMIAKDIIIK